MENHNWNHDLMEHILSLMELLHRNGISAERASGTDMRGVLPEDPGLKTAYEMVRFMEEIPGGFMVYRADGDERIVYANMGLLRIFRCESWERFQELTGGSFRGVVHPEDQFSCPGFIMVEDRRIRCHKVSGHGAENFVQATMNSCKPVFI